jgi:hypothetical protein
VYVVFLSDSKGDGRAAYYVGMTGLTPEQRFENHTKGIQKEFCELGALCVPT